MLSPRRDPLRRASPMVAAAVRPPLCAVPSPGACRCLAGPDAATDASGATCTVALACAHWSATPMTILMCVAQSSLWSQGVRRAAAALTWSRACDLRNSCSPSVMTAALELHPRSMAVVQEDAYVLRARCEGLVLLRRHIDL